MMKIIYNNIIPFDGFIAINLFGILFARKQYKPLSKNTLLHESIHTLQIKETGYIFFYIWYLIEWIIRLIYYFIEAIYNLDEIASFSEIWHHLKNYLSKAYYNISFEKEAYINQYDDNYIKKRKYLMWLKYI